MGSLAMLYEGLGADPATVLARVLAVESPLARALREAAGLNNADVDAGLPEVQLPACVVLNLLRLEWAYAHAPAGRVAVTTGHSAGFLVAAAAPAADGLEETARRCVAAARRAGAEIARVWPSSGDPSAPSCALLLPGARLEAVAVAARGQTRAQIALVNAPASVVLSGAAADLDGFGRAFPRTKPLPIRWPVHSPLLGDALGPLAASAEFAALFPEGRAPAARVLAPDGAAASDLRGAVAGTLTSSPVLWPLALDGVAAAEPDTVLFLGDSGLCSWYAWRAPLVQVTWAERTFALAGGGREAAGDAAKSLVAWLSAAARTAVSSDADVGSLGLASVALFDVLGKIRRDYDASFPLERLKAAGTVGALAAELEGKRTEPRPDAAAPRVAPEPFNLDAAVAVAKLFQVGVWRLTVFERLLCRVLEFVDGLPIADWRPSSAFRVLPATVQRPTYYPVHAGALVMSSCPVTAPPLFRAPAGASLAELTTALSVAAAAMPCVAGCLLLQRGYAFLATGLRGIPVATKAVVYEPFDVPPIGCRVEATFSRFVVRAAFAGIGLGVDYRLVALLARRQSMLEVEVAPYAATTGATWCAKLAMNHVVFYGDVQRKFMECWAHALTTGAPTAEAARSRFGLAAGALAGWLLDAPAEVVPPRKAARRPRALAGHVCFSCLAAAPPRPALDGKQAGVARALEWLEASLPAAYRDVHVWCFPPTQLHATLGRDPDQAMMMWWIPRPYHVVVGARPVEATVLGLWGHAERAMAALVDGDEDGAIRREWLWLMDQFRHESLPRYAACAGHHPDWVAYRFDLVEARHGPLPRSGGAAVLLSLNLRDWRLPAAFAPVYPLTAPDDAANARAWDDARPALAPLAGDVYAYLEVKLPDDATAMFSYHLFGLA